MNRKKATMLIIGLAAMLTAMLCVLFGSGTIKLTVFIALILVVNILASAAVVIALRKLNP